MFPIHLQILRDQQHTQSPQKKRILPLTHGFQLSSSTIFQWLIIQLSPNTIQQLSTAHWIKRHWGTANLGQTRATFLIPIWSSMGMRQAMSAKYKLSKHALKFEPVLCASHTNLSCHHLTQSPAHTAAPHPQSALVYSMSKDIYQSCSARLSMLPEQSTLFCSSPPACTYSENHLFAFTFCIILPGLTAFWLSSCPPESELLFNTCDPVVTSIIFQVQIKIK